MLVKLNVVSAVICFFFFFGCVPKQVDINYGVDSCAYCKMSIVDPKFGAELITEKGRVYKFDAIECMVHYDHEMQKPAAKYLVNVISRPGILVPATDCRFVFSKEMPSPMGANLSAHLEVDDLPVILTDQEIRPLAWDTMRKELIERNKRM